MSRKKLFYDPRFAIATAILSLLMAPIWILMLDIRAGLWFTLIFSCGMLVFMLCQSWRMAREDD